MALFSSSLLLNPSSAQSPLATSNPFSTTFAVPTTTPVVVDPGATSKRNAKKRRRTSDAAAAAAAAANTSAAYGGRASVKSAQENIEKLIKVLEKGDTAGGRGGGSKKSGKKAGRRRSRGVDDGDDDDDDAPLTMDELRKRMAEEEAEEGNAVVPPKKKKIKYGLDGRPVLPPGVSSIAQLEGKAKSAAKKIPKQVAHTSQPKVLDPPPPPPPPAAESEPEESSSDEQPANLAAPSAPQTPMTSLQSSLAHKLSSAKFRWLNEQLYTLPSTQAWDLMREEGGSAFADYHDSHRQQTAAWPSPPLPYIISAIRATQPARTLHVIVDLGCGDASLAKQLNGHGGYVVLSYDLVGDIQPVSSAAAAAAAAPTGPRGWVVPGDFLDAVPLPGEPGGHEYALAGWPAAASVPEDGNKKKKKKTTTKRGKGVAEEAAAAPVPHVVDSVVCCLSLMGVNWVGGIYEACRILKTGGVFHIAEVTSRLISHKEFIALVESFGFHLEEHTAPTTHFDLFRFTKTSFAPLGVVKGQTGWNERLAQGPKIMKGCVYKKR
ncbi:hypothetical protein NliqN6_0460 [Naganishia liquefaciens]|uniref:Ribosomal RNA-processing protein 8 n=1 Tax=Naganishia liquefaciens TaxID=104408 RepID=A0A8H3TN27_9TREE|nr:hypothetical protein NliqN6_0460 [Naganishia liquefaciens]